MLLTHYIQISRAIGECAITMIGRKQGFYHSRSLCCGWYCQTHDLDKTIPWTTRIKHYRQYAVSREQKCNVVWTKRMGEFMRMLPSSKHLIFLRDSDRSNWNEKYKYQVLPSRSKDRWLYVRTPTWKELTKLTWKTNMNLWCATSKNQSTDSSVLDDDKDYSSTRKTGE